MKFDIRTPHVQRQWTLKTIQMSSKSLMWNVKSRVILGALIAPETYLQYLKNSIQISPHGDDSINETDLKHALDLAGYKLPNHRVRELILELKSQSKIAEDQRVSKELFKEVIYSYHYY